MRKVRFFNRFDKETVEAIIKKTELRVMKPNEILFLENHQAGIVVNGELFMFSHSEVADNPYVAAIYSKFI